MHDFLLARDWISRCIKEHTDSCPSSLATLPTRVLDVGDDLNKPRLYVTQGELGIWAALSHCWGREVAFVTEYANLSDRQRAIALEDVPSTLRDAIKITRQLGYQYLWIDTLCIIQDSVEDWTYESNRMQHYYKHSIVTIASDLASSDHQGFLSVTRQQRIKPVKVPFQAGLIPSLSHAYIRDINDVGLPGYKNKGSPLEQRAWALQETLLAPRTLHYTQEQLVFECQKYTITESDFNPKGLTDIDVYTTIKQYFLKPECSRNDSLVRADPTYAEFYKPLSRWYRVIEEYFLRSLTFESDRLAAISGIAREIQQQSGMTYKAGIWVEDLHVGLLWSIACRGEKHTVYHAPSWSWASLIIHTDWGKHLTPDFQVYLGQWEIEVDSEYPKAEVLEVDVGFADGNPYGRIISGRLELKSRWLPIKKWRGKTPMWLSTYWRTSRSHLTQYIRMDAVDGVDQMICSFDEDPEGYDDEELPDLPVSSNVNVATGSENDQEELVSNESEDDETEQYSWDTNELEEVSLLQIARLSSSIHKTAWPIYYALMLRPVDSEGVQFRRVGVAEVPDVDGLADEGWELKTVVII